MSKARNLSKLIPSESGKIEASDLAVGAVETAMVGQLAGMRNKIINGDMNIAQRGTSFPAAVSPTWPVDRFNIDFSSTAVTTVSQQADIPSDNEFQYSARVTVTTADTSLAASDYYQMLQKVEGHNARDLIGKTFTLSFWVRSAKTGVHCAFVKNGGADRTYVREYTINAANTWEKKVITFTGGLITAGTWNWTNGIGLFVGWALASGSSFVTTPDSWQTGNFMVTSNQVNCLDTIGNIFAITGVQLEVGSVATPFEHRPYGAELALCQRYYEAGTFYGWGYAGGGGTLRAAAIRFVVTKRAAPTIGLASLSYANASAATAESPNVDGSGLFVTATATGAFNVNGSFTAAIEL